MINIIFFIILVLLVLFYPSNLNIEYINKKTGKELFESDEFRQIMNDYQKKEIYYISNKRIVDGDRKKLVELFLDSIIQPDNEQKKRMEYLCKKANKILIGIFGTSIDWKFLLWKNNLYWDFYITIKDVIVISDYEMGFIMKERDSYGVSFLVHEAFHIFQKGIMKDIFEEIYVGMNFVKKNIKNILWQNKFIKENWITNPDGLNGEWLYETDKDYICPLLLMDENGNHSKYYVRLDKNMRMGKIGKLSDCEEYNVFGKIWQSYHPNEIFGSYIQSQVNKN